MTYEEIKAKVDALSDEALKLDKIDDILKEAGTVLEKKDISCLTRIALEIGYLKQLNDAYKEVRYLWLHIYNLKRDLETEGENNRWNPGVVPPTEEEMAKMREEVGDD